MTELQETKVCPKCGGEMVLRTRKADGGKFYACKNQECRTYENIDEYKSVKKSSGGGYTKEASTVGKKNPDNVVKELKKLYDEITAEFAGDYPEIIGDAQALQALVATAFIERNKRL